MFALPLGSAIGFACHVLFCFGGVYKLICLASGVYRVGTPALSVSSSSRLLDFSVLFLWTFLCSARAVSKLKASARSRWDAVVLPVRRNWDKKWARNQA